jgi:hypothetical protein
MKRISLHNKNITTYFVFAFLTVLCIIGFYISCKSKSPTEIQAVNNSNLSAQRTNNAQRPTTTTTTIKARPMNAANMSTTIVTSRFLTTTTTSSTTTTTTSIPGPITTSIQEPRPYILWCPYDSLIGIPPETILYKYIKENATLRLNLPEGIAVVFIGPNIRNAGDIPAENVYVRCLSVTANPPHPSWARPFYDAYNGTFAYIDNDNNCVWDEDIWLLLILIANRTYTITYNQNNPGKKYSSFTIITTGEELTPERANGLKTLRKGIDLKQFKNMIRDHKQEIQLH